MLGEHHGLESQGFAGGAFMNKRLISQGWIISSCIVVIGFVCISSLILVAAFQPLGLLLAYLVALCLLLSGVIHSGASTEEPSAVACALVWGLLASICCLYACRAFFPFFGGLVEALGRHLLALWLALALLAPLAVGWIVAEGYYYQGRCAQNLENDLGFEYRKTNKGISIASVKVGGAFEQAGFAVGDVILGVTLTGLLRQLEQARGGAVKLTVASGNDDGSAARGPARVVVIRVPEHLTDRST
jgi:hypothetical protein